MGWVLLPTNYVDAVWSGLKKYQLINNNDSTVSLQDVTVYSQRENSFFGAKEANRMNEALNTIMSMVENGTDLYEAFQNYFTTQKQVFTEKADQTANDFKGYADKLKAQGDQIIEGIKTDYREEMDTYEGQQQQVFDAWFQAIRDRLSQDAAGELMNYCIDLDERLSAIEYMVVHNEFAAPLNLEDEEGSFLVDENDNAILLDWKYKEV